MGKYSNRALVSFEDRCPLNCKHCYTYELDTPSVNHNIPTIVSNLSSANFDVLYISQRYENFYDEDQGYSLCKELFMKFHKDIFIITRSYLSDSLIRNLCDLNKEMQCHGNNLILAVSICATSSYTRTENPELCPTPTQRMMNLQRAHIGGIRTILMLRPIFPDTIIPVSECTTLVSDYSEYIDAVVTSGLIVTDGILQRLQLNRNLLSYLAEGDSSYLDNLRNKEIMYVDVEAELRKIASVCGSLGIPCFRHSMPALNAIVG